jgi:hypothetical protein
MILIPGNNPINQEIADHLLRKYGTHAGSQFIIDVDQQFFTKELSPEAFATYLMEKIDFLPTQDIYLVVSEIHPGHSLGVFAHHLSRILSEHYQKKINIHIPSYQSSSVTFIVPPDSQEQQWKIFGVNDANLKNKNVSYETLLENENKHCIFANENLLEWMNDPQQTFDGTAYVWGE